MILSVLVVYLFIHFFLFCQAAAAGMLYFKNGKTVLCDYAWVENDLVYVVLVGKQFAITYNKSEIDMVKSGISPKPPPRHQRSETAKPPVQHKPEAPRTATSSLPQPFQDLFPLTTFDREEFMRKVDARLGGNPYFLDLNEEAESEFSNNLPALWDHVFSGRIPYKASLNPDQRNYWNDVLNRYRADVWKKKEIEIRQAKEIRNLLMREFEIQTRSNVKPAKPTPSTQPKIRIYPASPP